MDYRHNIFLFLSNTGGREITQIALDNWNKGRRREERTRHLIIIMLLLQSQDISLTHLEPLVADGAFNEAGGLQYSRMIKNSLVDVFVPFLPLERQHVKICARNEFDKRQVEGWTEQMVESVADQLTYW